MDITNSRWWVGGNSSDGWNLAVDVPGPASGRLIAETCFFHTPLGPFHSPVRGALTGRLDDPSASVPWWVRRSWTRPPSCRGGGVEMQVKVLGPLDVTVNGRSITPTASKARQTLAMLALHAGQLVTVPTLMEELWGAALPRKPLQSVQTYILILRRMIDDAQADGRSGGAKSVLTTAHGGYLLAISPHDLDIHRYERMAGAGRRAMEIRD